MRRNLDAEKLQTFMQELAARARSPGNVYFTGGGTALLLHFRQQTIDLDLKFDPEPAGAFEAIAELKNKLDINVELASPADFIPVTADWKKHSLFISQIGQVGFYHYDLRAQALSKIERGYSQDLLDARDFLKAAGSTQKDFRSYFLAVKPGLLRYPAINPNTLEDKVERFLNQNDWT